MSELAFPRWARQSAFIFSLFAFGDHAFRPISRREYSVTTGLVGCECSMYIFGWVRTAPVALIVAGSGD